MISKIIQKEKERQKKYLTIKDGRMKDRDWVLCCGNMLSHKQSLINLKEYMESRMEFIEELLDRLPKVRFSDDEDMWDTRNITVLGEKNQLTEDMEELTKMIERYD